MKKPLAIALLLAVLVGGYFSISPLRSRLAASRSDRIPEKYVAAAELRDIDYSIEVSGDVSPEAQLDIKTEVGGKIRELKVVPGQTVKSGDVLCKIDDTDLRNQKASAETKIVGAQLEVDRVQHTFNRDKELMKAKLITKEVFDNVGSDLAVAKNNLIQSQRSLQTIEDMISKTQVISPTAGTVLSVPVIEGQVVVGAASVNSGTTLMTIADLSKLLVDTNINQVDVTRLQNHQPVKLTVESVKEEVMDGAIIFIAPVASTKNGVKGFEVKASIEKPSARLRPGMTVNMTVPVAHATGATSVPVSAVFKGDNENHVVYVVNSQEKTEEREVTLGVTNLDYAEIKTGVKVGDRVLTVEPRILEKNS